MSSCCSCGVIHVSRRLNSPVWLETATQRPFIPWMWKKFNKTAKCSDEKCWDQKSLHKTATQVCNRCIGKQIKGKVLSGLYKGGKTWIPQVMKILSSICFPTKRWGFGYTPYKVGMDGESWKLYNSQFHTYFRMWLGQFAALCKMLVPPVRRQSSNYQKLHTYCCLF